MRRLTAGLVRLGVTILFLGIPHVVLATELSLKTNTPTVKVDQIFWVDIALAGGEDTLGTDVIISYDPQKLEAKEVKAGTLYPTYNPVGEKRIDATQGKMLLSGSGGLGQAVQAQGSFASIIFQAKKAGVTTVAFDYQPGSTATTGIIDSAGNDLITTSPLSLSITIQNLSFLDRFFSLLQRFGLWR